MSLPRLPSSLHSSVSGPVCGPGHPSPGSVCCLAGGAPGEVGPEVASQVIWPHLPLGKEELQSNHRYRLQGEGFLVNYRFFWCLVWFLKMEGDLFKH